MGLLQLFCRRIIPVSNVINFLERFGADADLRHAPDEAVNEAGGRQELTRRCVWRSSRKDQGGLERLLGADTNVLPKDQRLLDEDEEEEEEDGRGRGRGREKRERPSVPLGVLPNVWRKLIRQSLRRLTLALASIVRRAPGTWPVVLCECRRGRLMRQASTSISNWLRADSSRRRTSLQFVG